MLGSDPKIRREKHCENGAYVVQINSPFSGPNLNLCAIPKTVQWKSRICDGDSVFEALRQVHQTQGLFFNWCFIDNQHRLLGFVIDSLFSLSFQSKKLSDLDHINKEQEVKFVNYLTGTFLLHFFSREFSEEQRRMNVFWISKTFECCSCGRVDRALEEREGRACWTSQWVENWIFFT